MSKHKVRIEDAKNNLVVRSATIEDAKVLTSWWNDGAVMAHAGFPLGLQQTMEQTKEQIKENETRLSQRCIIEANNQAIGELSFYIGDQVVEIGIKICEVSYQNQGLGTIFLQMLIQYLFEAKEINDTVMIHKIILDTNLNNIRAQHVYEKLGFIRVAVRIDDWKDQLGNLQSSVDYELTRDQYEVCLKTKNNVHTSYSNSSPSMLSICMDVGVRYITDKDLKEEIAKSVLSDLPEWFGLPESTAKYITESREMPFFSYYKDDRHVGFVTLKETGECTAEIYVMGVLKEYHRQGIGETLFRSFVQYANNAGYEYLQVKTVEKGYYEEYDRTRLFYERMGFKKFECFPTLWDEWNPCLVMVQSVSAAMLRE